MQKDKKNDAVDLKKPQDDVKKVASIVFADGQRWVCTPFNAVANKAQAYTQAYIMGIVNLTPDSFYDGGKFDKEGPFIEHVESMIESGVDILDLGGESSRPGAKPVSLEEEIRRVIPKLKLLKRHFPKSRVSIDTTKDKLAERACGEGADILNDISAGTASNNAIFYVAKKYNVPIIIMHMRGTPKIMQSNLHYEQPVIEEVVEYLQKKVELLHTILPYDGKIILDAGIGFGKNLKQNLQLLSAQGRLVALGYPVLVGVSMKSMLAQLGNETIDDRRIATVAVHLAALLNGANIVRVHDARAAKSAIRAFLAVQNRR